MRKIYFVVFLIFPYFNVFCSSQEVLKNNEEYVKEIINKARGYFFDYLEKENCNNIFDLISNGHTRSSLHYYTWATIDTILRQFIGAVWVYKTWKDFEFYYGSVIGIGWYPRSLNFNKRFRVGFFDMFVNLTSLATTLCNLFLTQRILKRKRRFFEQACIPEIQKGLMIEENYKKKKIIHDIYYFFLEHTPACNYIRKLNWFEVGRLIFALLMSTINFSFINFQMFSGFIRVKFLTFLRIAMCFKHDLCWIFANICFGKEGSIYAYTHAVAGLPFFFRGNESVFEGKISIFLLILQLFTPNIEINISALH